MGEPVPEPTGVKDGTGESAVPDPVELRDRVMDHLRCQGFAFVNNRLIGPVADDKDQVRAFHSEAVKTQRAKAAGALARHEDQFIWKMARPDRIDVNAIRPVLVPVDGWRAFEALLWRWCSLHWSVPVSRGYGRRIRFLVVDQGHGGKVMGLIGLADPVFALSARDVWVGWDVETRSRRLANVMDAFVLGAVPPYSALRAGKLVALLATSNEVRSAFDARYRHKETVISRRDPDARLALITTTSALGRSSLLNRLSGPDGQLAYVPVGYTLGSGDFHLSGAIYDDLARFAQSANVRGDSHAHSRWKVGPRNRREVVQRALVALGLPGRQLRFHGVRRQVFVAPLLHDVRDFLINGSQPRWTTRSANEMAEHWARRWARPRAARDDAWREFDRRSWRLYGPGTGDG